jgi:hypothetical protein
MSVKLMITYFTSPQSLLPSDYSIITYPSLLALVTRCSCE